MAEAVLPGRVHGGAVGERERFLPSAGLCPRMPSARFETAAAVCERAWTGLRAAWGVHSRATDARQGTHDAHDGCDARCVRARAIQINCRFLSSRCAVRRRT